MLRAFGRSLPELQRLFPTTSARGGDGKAIATRGEQLCPYKAIVWAPVCCCCLEPGGAAAPAPAGMPLKTGTNTARRGRTQALSHTFQAPHSCPYMSKQHLLGSAVPTPGSPAGAAAAPQPGPAAPARPGGRCEGGASASSSAGACQRVHLHPPAPLGLRLLQPRAGPQQLILGIQRGQRRDGGGRATAAPLPPLPSLLGRANSPPGRRCLPLPKPPRVLFCQSRGQSAAPIPVLAAARPRQPPLPASPSGIPQPLP